MYWGFEAKKLKTKIAVYQSVKWTNQSEKDVMRVSPVARGSIEWRKVLQVTKFLQQCLQFFQ